MNHQMAIREAVAWCHHVSWVLRCPVAWLVAAERGKSGLWHAHVLLVGVPEQLGRVPAAMWHQRNGFVKVTRVDDSRGIVIYATKQAALSGEVELSDTLSLYRERLTDKPRVVLYPLSDDEHRRG